MHTEAINHDPAMTFLQTGHEQPGRPSFGTWVSYGLGSANERPAGVRRPDLAWQCGHRRPTRSTRGSGAAASCPRTTRASASAPAAIRCSTCRTPRASTRRRAGGCSTTLAELNQQQHAATLRSRDRHPDRAVRDGLPHADLGARADRPEPRAGRDLRRSTGPKPARRAPSPPTACWPGGWPSAASGSSSSTTAAGTSTTTCRPTSACQCQDTDQPCAALLADLKQRGLLDDTLVVWGGEFGRTTYSQGTLDRRPTTAATTIPAASPCGWPAAASGRASPTARPTTTATTSSTAGVHVHDLNATILHCLGIDHTRLTFRFQGRDYRLTDVHGEVGQADPGLTTRFRPRKSGFTHAIVRQSTFALGVCFLSGLLAGALQAAEAGPTSC